MAVPGGIGLPPIDAAFKRHDRDEDGKLTVAELKPALQQIVGRRIMVNDEVLTKLFPTLDQNGDGVVTIDEFYDIFEKADDYVGRAVLMTQGGGGGMVCCVYR